MYLTGFADEAARDLDTQIKATKELGWSNIESRCIDGVNIHDLPEDDFKRAADKLDAAGVHVNCFGSAIANWQKSVLKPEDFDADLAAVDRAIPRMHRLGSKLIRIMTYALVPDRGPEDQCKEERFRRVREITRRFLDAGIQPVHENCMNYGGMGWKYTLEIVENVPGIKLVFDTGNPVFTKNRMVPPPYPMEDPWEFYEHVRDHVAYVHVKDGRMEGGQMHYTYPDEGSLEIQDIFNDLVSRGYDGGISIEPHLGAVFHDKNDKPDPVRMYTTYVEYGRRVERMLKTAGAAIRQA